MKTINQLPNFTSERIPPLFQYVVTEIVTGGSRTIDLWTWIALFPLEGISKRWAPGCVKLSENVAFWLSSAGRRTQLFHLIFTQPGALPSEHSCTKCQKVTKNKEGSQESNAHWSNTH